MMTIYWCWMVPVGQVTRGAMEQSGPQCDNAGVKLGCGLSQNLLLIVGWSECIVEAGEWLLGQSVSKVDLQHYDEGFSEHDGAPIGSRCIQRGNGKLFLVFHHCILDMLEN